MTELTQPEQHEHAPLSVTLIVAFIGAFTFAFTLGLLA